jgi:hypothetical protein
MLDTTETGLDPARYDTLGFAHAASRAVIRADSPLAKRMFCDGAPRYRIE